MLEVPTIETERLKLRAHRLDDFYDFAAMWVDPVVVRYTIGAPSSKQRTMVRMTSYIGHWLMMGFGYWAIEEKSTGQFIGDIGFADFKREAHPAFEGVPEVGWGLVSHAHGKGYASEALRAVLEWGDRHLKTNRTVCLIHIKNTPSLKLAQKFGYKEFARAEHQGQPTVLFERHNPLAKSKTDLA